MTMYLHCRDCVQSGNTAKERLQCSVDENGLTIACITHKKIIGVIDPVQLLQMMENPNQCDLCARGEPHVH